MCDKAYLSSLATTIYFCGVMLGGLAVRNLIWSLGKETLHSRNTLHAHCCRGFHCIFQLVRYVRIAEVSAGHTHAGKIRTSYMGVLVINWLAVTLTLLRRKMRSKLKLILLCRTYLVLGIYHFMMIHWLQFLDRCFYILGPSDLHICFDHGAFYLGVQNVSGHSLRGVLGCGCAVACFSWLPLAKLEAHTTSHNPS